MKVVHQKNVYYLDLNKNLYRGYVETTLGREQQERTVVYRAMHLEIENAELVGTGQVEFEYINGKRRREEEEAEEEKREEAGSRKEEGRSGVNTAIRVKIPESYEETTCKLRLAFRPTADNPVVLWYKPVSARDKHKEVVAANFNNNSSSTAPYIDAVAPFDLYYVIPNTEEVKVVSSGNFKSIKEEDRTIVYLYSALSHPRYFMFSAGTYDQCDVFNDNDKRKIFTPFSLAVDCADVQGDLQALIRYVEGFTKTTELSTCNVVFSLIDVDGLVARNMAIFNCTALPSPRDIEMAYLLKRRLAETLSRQVYHFLGWCTYDAWIYVGFSGFLADYALRYLLGNNEFLYAYFEDRAFVVAADVLEPPLFYTGRKEAETHSEFFRRKSRLVFHCMEANLSFAFLQKISDELIEAKSMEGRRCFTPRFIRIVKDATGKDLKPFFDFYVFRPGVMKIRLQFQINKKKNSVRVSASYSPTSQLPGANKRLQGGIEIKSIELEGSFDHTIVFGGDNVFFYHTRTKKKKKEDEEETMPLLYIRADPKQADMFEYLVEQPDYMHIEQLQDKSVVGQMEAIISLGSKPTLASCEALERMLDNAHAFYKIRARIVHVLRQVKIDEYDGLQRIIQYFIRTRCVPNSTVLKSNEFGLVSYFVQKHLVAGIGTINPLLSAADSKMILAFLENILNFNDNSLSQFEDSWYIAKVISLVSNHTCFLTCFGAPAFESQRMLLTDVPPDPLPGCIDKLERFRVSDMVFPSNNNIITRTCILSYVRLAFYNKLTLSRKSLQNLAMYPNLHSIRLVAVEGLLLLFSDSVSFVLTLALTETPLVTESVLDLILKIMLLGLKVHLTDTDEYDVNLTERLRDGVAKASETLQRIQKRYAAHLRIADLAARIQAVIEGKYVHCGEYPLHALAKYDYAKEENNRLSILKMPSTAKRLRVANMDRLKELAFEETHVLRLPRIKNLKPRHKEVPKLLKIRLTPGRFLVKHTGNLIIRLKAVRRDDTPHALAGRYRDSKGTDRLDESILRSKSTEFFTWQPRTSDQIVELAREATYIEIYQEIEKALIFTLSYSPIISKTYQAAKNIYATMEMVFFNGMRIRETIRPMGPDVKEAATALLERLIENPAYGVFYSPVDLTELRNYADIVRYPICLEDVRRELPTLQSVDCFIAALERVCTNCMRYNDCRSVIVETAQLMLDEIREFRVEVEPVDSMNIIRQAFIGANVEGVLDSSIEILGTLESWGDLERELSSIKKRYSRSSRNGKLCVAAVKYIRDELWSWFLYDGLHVLLS